jgi:hypothetical protein
LSDDEPVAGPTFTDDEVSIALSPLLGLTAAAKCTLPVKLFIGATFTVAEVDVP